MNIVHLVFGLVGKGTYWRSFYFARWLVAMGHTVTLVATSPQNHLRIEESLVDSVHLIQTPDLFSGSLRSGWDLWNSLRRILWLRSKHYDLVHAFEARPTVLLPMLYLQERKHIPVVMDWADWFGKGGSVEQRTNQVIRTLLRPVETFFEESFRNRAAATTVICSVLGKRAQELGIAAGDIHLIPNGCNTNGTPAIEIKEARRRAKLPPDGIYIGYVGAIFPTDFELLSQTFDRVVEQVPGVRLILAGYFPYDGRKWTRYPEAVIQTGPLDERSLADILASCDLFWLPLRDTAANRGRWPLKLTDYMSYGRPCVATAVGDVKLLLEAEPIGLLSTDCAEDMAEKTVRLIEEPALRDKMGRHARHLAEGAWNWSEKTKQLEAVYQQVVSGNA